MAFSQQYTAVPNDVITSARWNNEFGNIYNNAIADSFIVTGATTATSLKEKMADDYYVEDFGAVGDGATNDATAINLAIVACGSTRGGGTVHFGSKNYAITASIVNIYHNVLLKGQGQGYSSNVTDALTAATRITWAGAAGGTMVALGPAASAAEHLKGGGIEGIFFNGASLAATGLSLKSVNNAVFDVCVQECTTVGVDLTVESTVATDPTDSQNNWFKRLVVIQQEASSGICLRLDGVVGNASLNHFGMIFLLHRDGVALQLNNCDGNVFDCVRIFRHGSGTGAGVIFAAAATNPTRCRSNTFLMLQPTGGAVTAQGTPTNTFASTQNQIFCYNMENGAALPVIELGASLSYSVNQGRTVIFRDNTSARLRLTRASNTAGQVLTLYENVGYNSTPAEVVYAYTDAQNTTVTAGAEDGTWRVFTKNAGADVAQLLAKDGLLIGASPTGTYRGAGSINAAAAYYVNGARITGREAVTYSASMTPNQRNGQTHTVTITDANAFTINNPTNSVDGDVVRIVLSNTSGGAHGAITWGAGYKMAGALAAIATGFNRTVEFVYNGTNWVESFRSAADVAN